jgi:hypothetical protein
VKSILLNALHSDKLLAIGRELLKAGLPVDQVAEELAALADDLVDWRTKLPTPFGEQLEKYDGPLIKLLLGLIVRKLETELGK